MAYKADDDCKCLLGIYLMISDFSIRVLLNNQVIDCVLLSALPSWARIISSQHKDFMPRFIDPNIMYSWWLLLRILKIVKKITRSTTGARGCEQVFCNILNHFLLLSQSILIYLGLSPSILVFLVLSWVISGNLG